MCSLFTMDDVRVYVCVAVATIRFTAATAKLELSAVTVAVVACANALVWRKDERLRTAFRSVAV